MGTDEELAKLRGRYAELVASCEAYGWLGSVQGDLPVWVEQQLEELRRRRQIQDLGRKPASHSASEGHTGHRDPIKVQGQGTGNFCPRCGSTHLDRKGGGCVRCVECQFDLGCSG